MIDRRKNDAMKQAMKEALREWLDDKYVEFGKWSMKAMGALALAALIVFILWTQGYHK